MGSFPETYISPNIIYRYGGFEKNLVNKAQNSVLEHIVGPDPE